VAYFQATGKRQMLDVMGRYVALIDRTFGPGPDQKHGYCGHEEIEMALFKLHRVTGDPRHLALAAYFINERGRHYEGKNYFDTEALIRKDPNKESFAVPAYFQAATPVRDQQTAEGHAVRAMYLFCGMADLALEANDQTLVEPLLRLWSNVTQRRMYVTGGVGSAAHGERFTSDYDLPNESAYAETCAAIGLIFWAHRMALLQAEGRYFDVLEQALYNGALAGIALDGKKFFYVNLLESRGGHHRQAWFGCACCPPNIARLLASLSGYLYAVDEQGVYVNLYASSATTVTLGNSAVKLEQTTNYPWDGMVRLAVTPAAAGSAFDVRMRLPAWCRQPALKVNGQVVKIDAQRGYACLHRQWQPGDVVELTLPMPVERLEAHPAVAADCGRVALQRGPLIYCVEGLDNGANLNDLLLPREARFDAVHDASLLGGVTVLKTSALRRDPGAWGDELYKAASTTCVPQSVTAIPYYAWDNRDAGEMLVWLCQGAC
jgi:DUF1680 family protein